MRRYRNWLSIFLLITVILLSPRVVAGKGVFGVSEELMQTVEQEQAFQRYLAENNFQLANKFPFLQSDLLPIQLLRKNSYFGVAMNPATYDILLTNRVPYIRNQGMVERFPLLPSEYMALVFYDESEKYIIEARSRVVNGFTVSYGYDAAKSAVQEKENLVHSEGHFTAQNAGLEFKLIPGMAVNADYSRTLGTETGEEKKSVSVAYNPVNFASISAGYSVISTNTSPFDFSVLLAKDQTLNQDDIIVKQLGLALRPTTNSQISASYVFVNEKGEPIRSTRARFAFRLGDEGTGLNATYEMENGQNHVLSTSAGLELGLLDLATLRAVYSTNTGNQAVSEGLQSSTVDVGLNLNIASSTSFLLQYKLFLPDDLLEDLEEEQVAEAKLILRF